MIYICSPSNDPHFNLALEQYVFDEMPKDKEYFMLWQNDNAIIIGKHQNTIAEINQEFVNKNNISVVRRLSGGGAVYHDMGNLNFTFIVNDGDNISNFDFGIFCRPIIKALDKIGVRAELNGRNDMTIDGKKFSGNSQYTKKHRITHHGTLLYNSNLSIISQSLNVSKDKIESKGIKSVRSRVTNIKDYMSDDIPLSEFKNLLLKYMFEQEIIEEYILTENDIKKINEIKEKIYATWEWNYGYSPKYNIIKERRIEGCGKFEIYMDIENGIITNFDVFGDYFGNGNKEDLKNILIGKKLEKNDLEYALKDIDISFFFNNITLEKFIDIMIL